MTTSPTLGAAPVALDLSGTSPVPLSRLVAVELRKLVDTRSGRWLLIIQAVLIVLASGTVAIVVATQDESFALMDFTNIAGSIMGLLLPVLGILAVTSEWTQRTNMATFTLEPRRGKVVAAKLVASVVVAVLSVLLAILVGYVSSAAASALGAEVDWTADVELLAGFTVLQVLGLLTGFAFGTLLLNTAAAIVVYVAYFTIIPGVLAVGAELLDWFADIRPWIDFNDAQLPLSDFGQDASEVGFGAVDWPQFLVAGLIWFVLPLGLGILRMLRAEVK